MIRIWEVGWWRLGGGGGWGGAGNIDLIATKIFLRFLVYFTRIVLLSLEQKLWTYKIQSIPATLKYSHHHNRMMYRNARSWDEPLQKEISIVRSASMWWYSSQSFHENFCNKWWSMVNHKLLRSGSPPVSCDDMPHFRHLISVRLFKQYKYQFDDNNEWPWDNKRR